MSDLEQEKMDVLKRIDTRTGLMLDQFHTHTESDNAKFNELHDAISNIVTEVTKAATNAINAQLTAVGIDASQPLQSQKEMRLLRRISDMDDEEKFFPAIATAARIKDTGEQFRAAGMKVITTALATFFVGAFWLGFKDKFLAMFH